MYLWDPAVHNRKVCRLFNGETTSTSSITFTYILMATKEGSFTLPGATITADGNQMVSNAVHINVLPADQANGASSGNSGRQGGAASRASSGTSVSNSDLFITATASKTTLYEQEAFLLTYKIYTLVDLRALTMSNYLISRDSIRKRWNFPMTVNGVLNTTKEETIRQPYTVNLCSFHNNRVN